MRRTRLLIPRSRTIHCHWRSFSSQKTQEEKGDQIVRLGVRLGICYFAGGTLFGLGYGILHMSRTDECIPGKMILPLGSAFLGFVGALIPPIGIFGLYECYKAEMEYYEERHERRWRKHY